MELLGLRRPTGALQVLDGRLVLPSEAPIPNVLAKVDTMAMSKLCLLMLTNILQALSSGPCCRRQRGHRHTNRSAATPHTIFSQ